MRWAVKQLYFNDGQVEAEKYEVDDYTLNEFKEHKGFHESYQLYIDIFDTEGQANRALRDALAKSKIS